jgi:hypothetical protein
MVSIDDLKYALQSLEQLQKIEVNQNTTAREVKGIIMMSVGNPINVLKEAIKEKEAK